MLERALAFIRFAAAVRAMGLGLAWTLHNVYPHDSRSPSIDLIVRLALARLADVAIAHSRGGVRRLRWQFLRTGRTVLAYHGHLIGWYPNAMSRLAARQRLGLPEGAFVYLLLGMMRPYKGVEELIAAFRQVADPDAVLLAAGTAYPESYGSHLRALAEGDPRIRLDLFRIPDEDLQLYFNAANLFPLPFRAALTSSSLVLAQSFGLPVLVPDVPSLLEYTGPGTACVIGRREPLAEALRRARAELRAGTLRCGDEVVAWARRFDWDAGARALAPWLARRR